MAMNDQLQAEALSSCKVLTIAPTAPKYSEVWMTRMNEMLEPDNKFVPLSRPKDTQCSVGTVDELSLSRNSGLPNKLHLAIYGRSIRKNLNELLELIPRDAVIFCHYLTTAVYLWDVLEKIPNKIFIHCHGHDVTWDRKVEALPFLPAHGFTYKKKVKNLLGKVSLIANSNCTKKKLTSFGFPERDISVNYLSVDTSELKPSVQHDSAESNVLYLGRLTDFKGPVETIKAFELAMSRGFKGRLDIVGGGDLMAKCLKLREASPFRGCIFIHGPVGREKALEFLSKAHIFTAHNKTSLKTGQEEAFGVSIIEAMAFGIPVITGASGGVIETVVDEVTGFLFPPGNVEAHARALLLLGRDLQLRSDLGRQGRKRVLGLFDSKTDEIELRTILDV